MKRNKYASQRVGNPPAPKKAKASMTLRQVLRAVDIEVIDPPEPEAPPLLPPVHVRGSGGHRPMRVLRDDFADSERNPNLWGAVYESPFINIARVTRMGTRTGRISSETPQRANLPASGRSSIRDLIFDDIARAAAARVDAMMLGGVRVGDSVSIVSSTPEQNSPEFETIYQRMRELSQQMDILGVNVSYADGAMRATAMAMRPHPGKLKPKPPHPDTGKPVAETGRIRRSMEGVEVSRVRAKDGGVEHKAESIVKIEINFKRRSR